MRKVVTWIILAAVVSAVEFGLVYASAQSSGVRITRLTQLYAFTAILLLYLLVLLIPLGALWPSLKLRVKPWLAGIGMAGVYFGVSHSLLAFFSQLGGFAGLQFLNERYIQAMVIGLCALVLMALLVTAYVLNLHSRWLRSRAIAVIGYGVLLVLCVHALMLGNHFTNVLDLIPQMFVTALLLLMLVEALWLDRWLLSRYQLPMRFSVVSMVSLAAASVLITLILVAPDKLSINVHSDHGVSGAAGLPVPQPSVLPGGYATRIWGDYEATIIAPAGDKLLRIELRRLSQDLVDPVGEAQLLVVDGAGLITYTLKAAVESTQNSRIRFRFDLTSLPAEPATYDVFAKFYLPTGALTGEITTRLP